MIKQQKLQSVALVGCGNALYMSASLLATQLKGQGINIVAVELPITQIKLAVESTSSEFLPLCEILKIPLVQVLKHCRATFSLGNKYIQQDKHWFVPFGNYGLNTEAAYFEQGVFRYEQLSGQAQLGLCSIASQAAEQNKFALAGPDRSDLQSALSFGVNLDSKAYGQILKDVATTAKVDFIFAKSVSAKWNAQGEISELELDNGQIINADLWIDCSGKERMLSEKKNLVPAFFANFCNASVSAVVHSTKSSQPFNTMQKTPWGWLRNTSNQVLSHYYTNFNSARVSEGEIKHWFVEQLQIPASALKFSNNSYGVHEQAWRGNCLSVGCAAVDFGQLVFSELFFVQAAIIQLLDIFPNSIQSQVTSDCFNQNWHNFVAEADCFVSLHILDNSHYLPEQHPLSQRIALFSRLGLLTPSETDCIIDTQWYGLLNGLGYRPERHSHYLNHVGDETLGQTISAVKDRISKLVAGMPTHSDFIKQFLRA